MPPARDREAGSAVSSRSETDRSRPHEVEHRAKRTSRLGKQTDEAASSGTLPHRPLSRGWHLNPIQSTSIRLNPQTFESTAERLAGQLVFAKLDTEASPAMASRLRVQSIPTLAMFENGKEIDRVAGALPPAAFEQWLNRTARLG